MTAWLNERPAWCPHPECRFRVQSQALLCLGDLPQAQSLDTHRLCLHGPGGTFDRTINRADACNAFRLLRLVFGFK